MSYSYEKFLSLSDGDILFLGNWDPGTPAESVPDHPHGNHYEITIVTSGEGTMYTDSIPTSVKEGDIYLSFPFDHHRVDAAKNSVLRYDFISFTVTNPAYSAEFAKIWIENISAQKRLCDNNKIAFLLEEIIDASKEKNEFQTEELDNLLTIMMISIIRHYGIQTGKPKRSTELCSEIIGYIDSHFNSITRLEDISKALGYHYNYLTSVFHKTTHLSLSKYFITRKLEIAKRLLSQEGKTVTEVAETLNYSSIQSFDKSFRKHYLICPKDIKKK